MACQSIEGHVERPGERQIFNDSHGAIRVEHSVRSIFQHDPNSRRVSLIVTRITSINPDSRHLRSTSARQQNAGR
jgi:hypothetical protein